MTIDERLQYHSNRAMQEMDLGLTAQSMEAARAHLRLSSLHMEQVQALGGQKGERPTLVID